MSIRTNFKSEGMEKGEFVKYSEIFTADSLHAFCEIQNGYSYREEELRDWHLIWTFHLLRRRSGENLCVARAASCLRQKVK
jgi:hypothetical protein